MVSSADFTTAIQRHSGALCDTISASKSRSDTVNAIFDGCHSSDSMKTSSTKMDLSNLLMESLRNTDQPNANQSSNTSSELQVPPLGGMYAEERPGPGTHSALEVIYDAAVGPLLGSLEGLRASLTSCATDDSSEDRLLMNIARTALRNAGNKNRGMEHTSTIVINSAIDLVKSMLTKLPLPQTFDLNTAVSAAKTFFRLNKDYDKIEELHASEEYREMSATNFRLKRMLDTLHYERMMMWFCDVGCDAKFWSYNHCVQHEENCGCGENANKRRKVSSL
jgi:hypothetical protein